MDREIEFLRQKCEYLERTLENCVNHISSLAARVAELERRPVAFTLPEETSGAESATSRDEAELLLGQGIRLWESRRDRRG
jgi:hypothetical protein